jgi:pimeloyl-ACP methyl ester carboxylesterase
MLVIEGSRDRVARSSVREALRSTYPRARFHTFDGAGHAPALEQPDAWLGVVSSFLRAAADA